MEFLRLLMVVIAFCLAFWGIPSRQIELAAILFVWRPYLHRWPFCRTLAGAIKGYPGIRT